ncbi:substrate-binding periplasmic protein [Pseudomonas sp. GZD-209]|uniref:substrate-binding periplasmic protein n=1 Tax=Pseudomonas sp. GZD-209 TaxID=3404807 RepID=UPI003BB58F5C
MKANFRFGIMFVEALISVLFVENAVAQGDCRKLTATGNPDYPPYLWRDPENPHKLIGASVDILKAVAKELDLDIDVVYAGPWSRAQEEAKHGRIDMVAGYFVTFARLEDFNFIIPPFLYSSSVVWTRKGEAFSYSGWDDLRGKIGGTLVNNSYGQRFDDYARDNLRLEPVPSSEQAFKKLLFKRNEYIVYEFYPGLALAQTLGVEGDLEALEPTVSKEGLHLAISKRSSCNTENLRKSLEDKITVFVSGYAPGDFLKHNMKRWRKQHENKSE